MKSKGWWFLRVCPLWEQVLWVWKFMRLVGGGDWLERFHLHYMCVLVALCAEQSWAGEFSLTLFILTTWEVSAGGPGWLRLWRAGGCSQQGRGSGKGMGLVPGSPQPPPCRYLPVPLPKLGCLHPICLAGMLAFEGMHFAVRQCWEGCSTCTFQR